MAICISIVVGKGGAGKTTTCVNLATAMAMDGKKVLVVDTDTQANTTMFLTGHKLNEKAFGGKGLFDMIRAWGLIDVENYIHHSQIDGIDVIVSNDATPLIPQQLETLEKVSGIKAQEFMLHALSQVAENYDFIVIDTPPAQNDVLVQNLDKVEGKCRLLLLGGSTEKDLALIQSIIKEKNLQSGKRLLSQDLKNLEVQDICLNVHFSRISWRI